MSSDLLEQGDPLQDVAQFLRTPVPVADGLPGRIAVRRVKRRRETFMLRGAGVVGVLAAVALAIKPSSTDRPITFVLDAPESHSVALVGDFTNWRSDEIQLHQANGGKWEVTVHLPPGRYRFAYLVDKNEWRADAEAQPLPDDYGRPTSVVTVSLEL